MYRISPFCPCLVLLLWACAAPGTDSAGDGPAPAPDLPDLPDLGTETLAADEVLIRVHYPVAAPRTLSLRGDGGGLNWDRGMPLVKTGPDLHLIRLTGVRAPLEFKPLVDDQHWSLSDNYRVLPGQATDIYPRFKPLVHYLAFPSAILGNQRGVWLYLPPSYGKDPDRRYPVIYMHDGQNLFDPAAAFGGVPWGVGETLDRGAAAADPGQRIPEAIVVGPENAGGSRLFEYTPTEGGRGGGGGDAYLRFLIEELKPRIDADLRTQTGPDATVLCGSSLGGLISAYAGLVRPQVFGRIGALSPSTWWDGRYLIGQVRARGGDMPRAKRVYLDSGDSGPSRDDVDNTRDLAQAYRDVGYRDGQDLMYVVQPGAQHNERYWAQRLPAALRFLLGGL